jgi:phage shock protein PspC (stress-responsive transcriptional regulator)
MQKIYRLEKGKKIAGICTGVAEIFNIDVTIVRLAFVFLTALTMIWPGIVTYLVGWYLIPVKDAGEGNVPPS